MVLRRFGASGPPMVATEGHGHHDGRGNSGSAGTVILLDHLSASRILLDGRAKRKEEVLSDLARLLSGDDAKLGSQILEGLLEREGVMSTGIGHGIAVPHARLDKLGELRLAIARYQHGVDFRALDGQPVYLAFGVVGPPGQADGHVKLLARVARLVKQGGAVKELLAATDIDQALEILQRHGT